LKKSFGFLSRTEEEGGGGGGEERKRVLGFPCQTCK